jgi:choline transport protein
MYAVYHEDFVAQKWHVFVSYIIATWLACFVVLFGNRFLPWLNNIGLFFILAGVFITIVVCAAMPGTGGRQPHASSSFVWKDWSSDIGYSSQGLVFCLGMLNGAYSVGTPGQPPHLIPTPSTAPFTNPQSKTASPTSPKKSLSLKPMSPKPSPRKCSSAS